MIDFSILSKRTEEPNILQDSNFNASARKIAFKKQIKKSNRDANFNEIVEIAGGLPKQNECMLIKTNGCSDTGSIFNHLIEKENIDEMYLSTWIISRTNIEALCKAVDDGKLNLLYFVASKRLTELTKSVYAFLVEQFQQRKDRIVFRVCNCHAKTFSVKTQNDNYYTVTGSGNWTENPRIENYVIFNDKEAFEHNKEWMTEILCQK